tara:strand:+ start:4516 stop:4764 length:249 start_codon:yes stop_codon:yes gene_type:complete
METTELEERIMFGCTINDLDMLVEECISIEVLILSILTQAQDAMLEGKLEEASQYINRSKYMLHELASSKIVEMFVANRLKN